MRLSRSSAAGNKRCASLLQEVRVTLATRCASPLCVSEKPIKYLTEGVPDRFGIITLFRPKIAFTNEYLDPSVFHFERDNPYTVAPTLA